MNEALVLILAFLWALALLPGAIRSRRRSPRVTVGGFQRAMDVLRQRPEGRSLMVLDDPARIVGAPTDGAAPAGDEGDGSPRGRARDVAVGKAARRLRSGRDAMTRRRRLFVRLLVATGVLLVVAVPAGGLVWLLFGVSAVVLVVYVALLRRWKLQRDEARRVVRRLTRAPRGGQPTREPPARERARVAGGGPFTEYTAVRWRQPVGHVRLRPWQR